MQFSFPGWELEVVGETAAAAAAGPGTLINDDAPPANGVLGLADLEVRLATAGLGRDPQDEPWGFPRGLDRRRAGRWAPHGAPSVFSRHTPHVLNRPPCCTLMHQDLSGDEDEDGDKQQTGPAAQQADPAAGGAARRDTEASQPAAKRAAAAEPAGSPLPVEVLLMVLSTPGAIGVRELASSMGVCVEWRGVVAAASGLWMGPLSAALPRAAPPPQQQQQQQQPAAPPSSAATATGAAGPAGRGTGPQPQPEAGEADEEPPLQTPQIRFALQRAPPPAPWRLPPGLLPPDPLLHLKAWRLIAPVAARFGCLRKGFEYVADAFAAIWLAVAASAAGKAAAAAGTGAGGSGGEGGSGAAGGGGSGHAQRRLTHVDQLWDAPAGGERLALDDKYHARAVQRMVGKLASHDWQLLYSGFSALVDAKAAEIAFDLRRQIEGRERREQQSGYHHHQQQQPRVASPADGRHNTEQQQQPSGTGGGGSGGGSWHAGGPLRGGLLGEMEGCWEGASARLAAEPEVLLALCGHGPRPELGIRLAGLLLARWEIYRRALEIFVSRCGPLGARVEQARQELVMAGPALRGSGGAALALTIPHVS
jgi:hypothetical protein